MSQPPPRKKLKQSTLFESFKKQISATAASDVDKDPKHTKETEKIESKRKHVGEEKSSHSPPLKEDNTQSCEATGVESNSESRILETGVPEISPSSNKGDAPEEDMSREEIRQKARDAALSRVANSPKMKEENAKATSSNHMIASQHKLADEAPPKPEQSAEKDAAEPESQGAELDASQDLFSDGLDDELATMTIPEETSEPERPSHAPMGAPLESFLRKPACSLPLPRLQPSKLHTVLFQPDSVREGELPQPRPPAWQEHWDHNHVRMPCSKENLYPKGGKTVNRWSEIEKALRQPIQTSWDLEEAILSYNSRHRDSWNFDTLHSYCRGSLEEAELAHLFGRLIPAMVDLALALPNICTAPIPLLRQGEPHRVSLSQQQVACLLANAFFCTFPRRNTRKRNAEFSSYPDINFNTLFMRASYGAHQRNNRKIEKLKCIFHYFQRVTENMPCGTISLKRQLVSDFPHWESSQTELSRLHVATQGTIEDGGAGMLQVDFANKMVGGGVLGHGCVQEEIRFLICPEMIISRLVTECLDDHECLLMTGCQRFSDYTGYADSFKWAGKYQDDTPRDEWGRCCTEVVAIDARVFRAYGQQFEEHNVRRELQKAYCGFCAFPEGPEPLSDDTRRQHTPAVATGNWGCGAFGGDVQLKGLLQMLAASEAGRDVCYFTFSDSRIQEQLAHAHQFLSDRKLCVSDVWRLIEQYRKAAYHQKRGSLFDFIYGVYGAGEDTDKTEEDEQSLRTESPSYWVDTP